MKLQKFHKTPLSLPMKKFQKFNFYGQRIPRSKEIHKNQIKLSISSSLKTHICFNFYKNKYSKNIVMYKKNKQKDPKT